MSIRYRLGLSALVVALLASGCGESTPIPPDAPSGPCRLATLDCLARVEIAPDRFLRLYGTHDLDAGASGPVRAVVLVHGAGRDAAYNFSTGIRATNGALSDSVVVVAPRFITTAEDPLPDEPFWTSGGWKRGHLSVSGGPTPRVSSYAALDVILTRLADPARFPDIREIVVAGHSAGGQVTHRYAAGGMDVVGVPVRYVVANPSTYLFLGLERPGTEGGWAVPDPAECPDYHDWHYGLRERNTYMNRLSIEAIRDRLVSRDVTILLGDADTGSVQLDQTCGANLQGEHRYARGLGLLAYMDAFHAPHAHTGVVVSGVGHSSRGVFLSPEGLAILLP